MTPERLNIERFLELSAGNIVVDVRSPSEYKHAHLPGAYNIPLFTDEERKIVGTAYKQENRETALKLGLDFFGPKMKRIVEEIELLAENSRAAGKNLDRSTMNPKTVLLYCWRGGMRSAAVAWLMDVYGFKAYTLAGGYKRFRNYVLDTFKLPFQFNVLGGYTGSGKTDILKLLQQRGEVMINLEEIAAHRGSAFGKMDGARQPSQEMFENILAQELRFKSARGNGQLALRGQNAANSPFTVHLSAIWLEDESQRIGDLNIPHELWKTIRQSPVYFMDIPFEKRLNRIVKEYGGMDKEDLLGSIERIQRRLGGLETRNAINYLLENNTIECFRILLKYYDKWYLKSLHNRNNLNSLLVNISCENVGLENAEALRQQATIS